MQWPAVPMLPLPSDPWKRKFNVHCPTSERTIAPGRTPGQVPVPSGAAAGTGINVHGTPPSVQLVELDDAGNPMTAAPDGAFPPVPEPHPTRAMTAAGIAMRVLIANIFRSYRMGRTEPQPKGADGLRTVNVQNDIR